MASCEVPEELPIHLPEEPGELYYCPVKVSKGVKIGYVDPSFVRCDHINECRALHASVFNHITSNKNTNFRAYPDRTSSEVKADGFPVVAHRTHYFKDPLLALSAKRKREG